MSGTVMTFLEGLFLIAFVAMIFTHATQFSTLVEAVGRNYQNLVTGLQGR